MTLKIKGGFQKGSENTPSVAIRVKTEWAKGCLVRMYNEGRRGKNRVRMEEITEWHLSLMGVPMGFTLPERLK